MNKRLVVPILFATLLATQAWAGAPEMPQFRWENFTTENGLPDNHVFQVKVDGNRVWAATENGLALYQNGRWKVYGTADGRSEEHTSELQSLRHLVCRLLLEKKKKKHQSKGAHEPM